MASSSLILAQAALALTLPSAPSAVNTPPSFLTVKQYLDTQDYFHAVDEAYKLVREKLREITSKEKATEVFNMNAENKGYYAQLFGRPDGTTQAEKDFFRGIGYLNLTIQFLRNEKAHTPAAPIEPNLAIHYISLSSLAYDLITRSESEK